MEKQDGDVGGGDVGDVGGGDVGDVGGGDVGGGDGLYLHCHSEEEARCKRGEVQARRGASEARCKRGFGAKSDDVPVSTVAPTFIRLQ